MTKRKRLLVLGGAALALALAAVLLAPACRWHIVGWARGEAVYRGRPTSYWRAQMQTWPGGVVDYRYTILIEPCTWLDDLKMRTGLGKAAFRPALLPLQQGEANAVPVLIELLQDADPDVRGYSSFALGQLGPKAQPAVPALASLLHDRAADCTGVTVAEIAADALKHIDPQAAQAAG